MTSSLDPQRAVRDAFLDAYSQDLDRDAVRTLAEYQGLFPGHEDAVAEEWSWLEPDAPAAGAESSGGAAGGAPARSIGPYRILDELGRGAQATVYRAEHETLRRQVALKVLHAQLLPDGNRALQRFRREAEATANLEHPGICSIYEMGQTDGLTWIAMQFVAGETLAANLRRRRAADDARPPVALLPEREPASGSEESVAAADASTGRGEILRILAFFEDAARAVHAAHERGLVHRDIKPSNLLVATDGRPVLLDFGLAHAEADQGLDLTRSTDVLGTPYYMAPEQLREGARVSRHTDVWALGVTLYECLAGVRPFDATSRERLYQEILTGEPAPLRSRRRRVPHDLEVVLQTALAKDPAQRYQTALDLAEDLRRVRRIEPIRARETPAVVRLWRLGRRHPTAAVSLGVTVVALVAALAVSLGFQRRLRANLVSTSALGLAGAAQGVVETRPMSALLLALEGIRREDRVETRSALYEAFAACRDVRAFRARGPILVADILPDASRLVTGTANGFVEMWAADGALVWTWRADLPIQKRPIMQVGFLGRDRVVVGVRGGDVHLFDVRGQRLHTYRTASRRLVSYTESWNHAYTTGNRLWVGFEGVVQCLALVGAGRDRLELVHAFEQPGVDGAWAVSADRRFVATAGKWAGQGRLWRRNAAGDYVRDGTLLAQPARIGSLAFSGSRLLVGTIGGENVCCDVGSGDRRRLGFQAGEMVCWLSPDRFVCARLGGQPTIWSVTGTEVRRIAEPSSAPSVLKRCSPRVSADGQLFAVAYQDGPIRVFDRDGARVAELASHDGTMPQALMFRAGSHELLSWAVSARLWSFESEGDAGWPAAKGRLMLSPDAGASRLLAGRRLYDGKRAIAEVRDSGEWSGNRSPFTPDGAHIVSRSDALRVFATSTGEQVFSLPDPDAGPWCLLGSSTEVLLFDEKAGISRVVDFRSGRIGPGPRIDGLVWRVAAHGDRVTAGVRPGFIATYERQKGADGESWRLVGTAEIDDRVRQLTYSPDGRGVLVGTDYGPIYRFDADLAAPPQKLVGHTRRLRTLRYSRCGRFIASVSSVGRGRLWLADGRPLAEIRATSPIIGCEFTPDSRRILTSHLDAVVRSWPLDPDELIAAARGRLTRDFTAAERARFAELLEGY